MAAARSAEGVRPEDSALTVGSAVGSHGSWSVVVNEQTNVAPPAGQEVPMQFPTPNAPPSGFRPEDKQAAPVTEADPDLDQNVPPKDPQINLQQRLQLLLHKQPKLSGTMLSNRLNG